MLGDLGHDRQTPVLKGLILPVMLNAAAAFDVFGYVFLALITPILLLCGYNIFRALLGQGRPPLHPVMRAFRRYGDPDDVVDWIDAEVADTNTLRIGKALVTRRWLLRPTLFRVLACPMENIVWAYHVKVAGDHVASLALRDGLMMGIALRREVPQLLAVIYQRVPWIEKGFSQELAKKWRKRRSEFIAEVEARRKT